MSLNLQQISLYQHKSSKKENNKHELQNQNENDEKINFVGFNQDNTILVAATSSGYMLYECQPFSLLTKKDLNSSVGIVELQTGSKTRVALVGGGGDIPYCPPTNVVIMNDGKRERELQFSKEIKNIRFRRDYLIVVLEDKILLHNVNLDNKITFWFSFETAFNPLGICALSPVTESCVLATLSSQGIGFVRVELLSQARSVTIPAHDNNISSVALNIDGSRLATASERGTLIRIFDTTNGTKMQEVRRGIASASIYSLSLNYNFQYLSCAADSGTMHMFALSALKLSTSTGSMESASNTKSNLTMLGSLVPQYFHSEWSFAKYHFKETPFAAVFGSEENTVLVVCANGDFAELSFEPEKEKCKKTFGTNIMSEEVLNRELFHSCQEESN